MNLKWIEYPDHRDVQLILYDIEPNANCPNKVIIRACGTCEIWLEDSKYTDDGRRWKVLNLHGRTIEEIKAIGIAEYRLQ